MKSERSLACNRPRDAFRQRGAVACRAIFAVAAFAVLSACEQNSFVPPPPPKVEVALPAQRSITRYLEATGNTAPTPKQLEKEGKSGGAMKGKGQ